MVVFNFDMAAVSVSGTASPLPRLQAGRGIAMQFSVLRRASCPDRLTGITGKLAKLRNAARVSISAKGIAKAAKKRRFSRFADEIISVPKLHTGHALEMLEPWWLPVGHTSVGSHSRADLFDGNPRRIEDPPTR
ncbi:hypothetical protein [Rhizobium leguminosarum]|uniref:hypothetical protein n=1 Tax=Rhizobium leguminosarum TaxID=384 RepID=UPI003F96F95F